MHFAQANLMVEMALSAARRGGEGLHAALEEVPAPVFVTDAKGVVVAFNEACARFTGHRPAIGEARCCHTWTFYGEDGDPLPPERCPMARTLAEKRPVRGERAAVERPDGTLATFTALPTPLFDAGGELAGAVNVLVDMTDAIRAAELRAEAEGCRRLAAAIAENARALNAMAAACEREAETLEACAPWVRM